MYLNVMYFTLLIIVLMILISIISLLTKKTYFDNQKLSPFECGFNPMSKKRMPFSIHFFLIAVIFLIFDIEIIIILPMILTLKSSMLMYWLLSTLMFITTLIVGLYHEWINGMLNWTK
nr:NADH dehydrogenase subunit 3 [Nionia sp.]